LIRRKASIVRLGSPSLKAIRVSRFIAPPFCYMRAHFLRRPYLRAVCYSQIFQISLLFPSNSHPNCVVLCSCAYSLAHTHAIVAETLQRERGRSWATDSSVG
jgi:hypothetical protein